MAPIKTQVSPKVDLDSIIPLITQGYGHHCPYFRTEWGPLALIPAVIEEGIPHLRVDLPSALPLPKPV